MLLEQMTNLSRRRRPRWPGFGLNGRLIFNMSRVTRGIWETILQIVLRHVGLGANKLLNPNVGVFHWPPLLRWIHCLWITVGGAKGCSRDHRMRVSWRGMRQIVLSLESPLHTSPVVMGVVNSFLGSLRKALSGWFIMRGKLVRFMKRFAGALLNSRECVRTVISNFRKASRMNTWSIIVKSAATDQMMRHPCPNCGRVLTVRLVFPWGVKKSM